MTMTGVDSLTMRDLSGWILPSAAVKYICLSLFPVLWLKYICLLLLPTAQLDFNLDDDM